MSSYYCKVGTKKPRKEKTSLLDDIPLYVETEKKLTGTKTEKIQYLVENKLISYSDAKNVAYIQSCSKKEYAPFL